MRNLLKPNSACEMHWCFWKLHRFVLKNLRPWFSIRLPGGDLLRVRYRDEGASNYLFAVKGDARLLRVTRAQFYQLGRCVDGQRTRCSCQIMNSLAEWGLSVRAEHLGGGAMLVEDGGEPLAMRHLSGRGQLTEVFTALRRWSTDTGLILLDYNENNWRWKGGQIKLVDVDANLVCPLCEARSSQIVLRRIRPERHRTDEDALAAFLKEEENLLWKYLSEHRA